jgi:chromatin segregation and condensation protein Rec8/ScpA/Scc1 (kleisin family)
LEGRKKAISDSSVSCVQLMQDQVPSTVAPCFFELLVLASKGEVTVTQQRGFAPIIITQA